MGRITETVKVLLIINVIFFLGTKFLFPQAQGLFALWFPLNPNFEFWQPLTHMFMHDQSSIFHILFNMYALWAFGSAVEASIGKNKFIFFYFSAGLGAALIHLAVGYFYYYQGYQALIDSGFSPSEITTYVNDAFTSIANNQGQYRIPNSVTDVEAVKGMVEAFSTRAVGASGAIYGVLVAFGMLFPNAELFLIFLPIPIKAKFFIPALILLDLFSGVTGFSLFGQNIANFAHIGGALFGFIMMWYWKKNSFNDKRWY
ncbi:MULTISPECIES: rhomboid family intramembrane serine protease [unclassified Leeuwenhoekiella]|uniref:rhomboid family intramembrane serine protease n=1 Tax=unclassified Leeuwenhoekiella TaxID=2615029 RepID=UPI000C43AE41|nr:MULTISPECIES: rhomboid family intramembrane serine protease [unclassified Leeuwenhoekiella]MAW94566.1 rhomboid family intramembrane serine protease [Leeuwenhoekiella sp.]MBA81989.1 rhomboid family intramembrane serine protease [Leeuwenhoekiella sp.]|tara:strand:+ start:31007 stop:31780 length:774 start_codon:yes stop_codon:yes gene_type:complete